MWKHLRTCVRHATPLWHAMPLYADGNRVLAKRWISYSDDWVLTPVTKKVTDHFSLLPGGVDVFFITTDQRSLSLTIHRCACHSPVGQAISSQKNEMKKHLKLFIICGTVDIGRHALPRREGRGRLSDTLC